MRRKQVLGAGALAAVLVAGGGWAAQAQANDVTAAERTSAAVQEAVEKAGGGLGVLYDYEVVRLENKNVPAFQRRVAECPEGKKVIGGGAEARGNQAILVGSFPTDDNTGWIGLGRQPGYPDVGISVFAICARTLSL